MPAPAGAPRGALAALLGDIASGRLSADSAVASAVSAARASAAFSAVARLADLTRDDAVARREFCALRGAPLAVKDNICTGDALPTCAGSDVLDGFVPSERLGSTVVNRLKAAGATVIGKTVMDEFGMGSAGLFGNSSALRNPLDRDRVVGGSSSGSAAAVAEGIVAAALGSDTGGSVRLPAAFCGVVGFKPSYGLFSRHGLVPFASSFDTIGLLTDTAADARILAEIIVEDGPDERDCTSVGLPPDKSGGIALPSSSSSSRRLRVGLPLEYNILELEDAVREGWDHAAGCLADEYGWEIVPVSLPHTRAALAAYYILATAEAASNLARYSGTYFGVEGASHWGAEVKRRVLLGNFNLTAGRSEDFFVQAQKVRRICAQEYRDAFAQVDLLLTPTAAAQAPIVSDLRAMSVEEVYALDALTVPASLAGLPAISLPVGSGPAGMPVAVQLLGPRLQDMQLLEAAVMLEQALAQRQT